jgi:hypothetical protein
LKPSAREGAGEGRREGRRALGGPGGGLAVWDGMSRRSDATAVATRPPPRRCGGGLFRAPTRVIPPASGSSASLRRIRAR